MDCALDVAILIITVVVCYGVLPTNPSFQQKRNAPMSQLKIDCFSVPKIVFKYLEVARICSCALKRWKYVPKFLVVHDSVLGRRDPVPKTSSLRVRLR
jgi:hypothetical protein